MAPLERLIGTEECSYCHLLTECLSLPDDGDMERAACRHCVTRAFDEVIGIDDAETDDIDHTMKQPLEPKW